MPTTPTIEKWVKGEKEKENCFQRALQWVRDDPYKIGWFVSELLTVLFIGIVALFCLAICVVLLGEVSPDLIRVSGSLSEFTSGPIGLIPWVGLAMVLFGAVFAYVYACKEQIVSAEGRSLNLADSVFRCAGSLLYLGLYCGSAGYSPSPFFFCLRLLYNSCLRLCLLLGKLDETWVA